MTSKTHLAIGMTGGILAGLCNMAYPLDSFINFTTIIISSTLPDIDIEIGIKHRRLTHSLLFTSVFALVIYFIYPKIVFPFIIGYGLHIFADSLTISGVQFLYPYKKFFALKLFATGSVFDIILRYICYLVSGTIFFYPTLKLLLSF